MYAELGAAGVRVPNGFALTAAAYRDALTEADAWPRLHALLDGLDVTDVAMLGRTRGTGARRSSIGATGTDGLRAADHAMPIASSRRNTATNVAVAVRSSATAEDLPTASFAGQHESYLNITRRRRSVRGLPRVLRLAVHRPRHRLSRQQRLRPFQGRAVGRRDEDGALRHGVERRDLHARHRDRLSRRGVHHRRLRAGRERRAGQGRSRRVLRAQADVPAGLSAPCCGVRSGRSSCHATG